MSSSIMIEEQMSMPSMEINPVKVIDKQALLEDQPESLFNAILEKDKELKRLLHEKEMLLSRLIHVHPAQIKDASGDVRDYLS
jgi:hypothetical protein